MPAAGLASDPAIPAFFEAPVGRVGWRLLVLPNQLSPAEQHRCLSRRPASWALMRARPRSSVYWQGGAVEARRRDDQRGHRIELVLAAAHVWHKAGMAASSEPVSS